MADGTARPIEELVPGDSAAGGTVRATLQVHYRAAAQLYSYKGVTVTGNHAVLDRAAGRFVRVSAAQGASVVDDSDLSFGGSVAGTPYSDIVFDLITSKHRIYVYTKSGPGATVVEFADYEEVDEAHDGSGGGGDRRLALLNNDAQRHQGRPPAVVAQVLTGDVGVRVRSSRPPAQVGQPAGLREIG